MVKPTRWGFMGAGKIASDFATAMKGLPKGEHEMVAVAAGSLQRAQDFAKKFNVKHAYEGYEKVATSPDVDVVYVNVISLFHFQCIKLALNAGKAVLCEKPLAINSKQVQELTNLARQKGVFFMEAFWSVCFPLYQEIRQALSNGSVGQPKLVQVNFGNKVDPKHRLFSMSNRGGVLMDMGCYAAMFSTIVFNGQRPEAVHAWGNVNEDGVDTLDCLTLKYPNGGIAQLTCSTVMQMENKALVYGTTGKIEVPSPFHCPVDVKVNGETIHGALPNVQGAFNFVNSQGLAHESQHVRECLLKGLKESPLMPLKYSEVIMSIMDEARHQVGVIYPEDSS